MTSLAVVATWVLASVCVGVVVGYLLSRGGSSGTTGESDFAKRERQATLKVLTDLLNAAERMTTDVQSHHTEIQETADHVGSLDASGEMEDVKQALLGHMQALLSSNEQLEKDLLCNRFFMEEQAQEIDDARREARTDALTAVANRKALDEKLQVVMAAWERKAQTFALILIDLDHFKRINDAHGHQAGDRVLEKVGGWLRKWIREGDFVGRYGGDEFVVLLPHTEMAVARKIAEMLCSRTAGKASRVAMRGEQVSVSFSIGVSTPREGDTVDSLLERADEALYRSKRRGRNQVHVEQRQPEEQGAVC